MSDLKCHLIALIVTATPLLITAAYKIDNIRISLAMIGVQI